ncbi:MAG: MBOAT family protein [Desulfobulbaceae bacterium]|nr:MBOAT family protein [Desulfobulbaceae bacterium]
MTFASLEFALLLLGVFTLYYFLPQRLRMLLLLGASYVFYCFWNPAYGLLIFASTLLDYWMALAISTTSSQIHKKRYLLVSVVGNLGILAYFKYTNFAIDSLRVLLGPMGEVLPQPLDLILPIGISFYTFQTMSYTIDVYRGKKKAENDFILIALYVCFFPQLLAGPIEKAKHLIPQLKKKQPFTFSNIETGIRLISWGLFKKTVVGDRLAFAAHGAYQNPAIHSTGVLAFSAAAMFVVVYLDFSAYSEIARGTASLFGIRLSRNFRFPHAATNIAEYWRRWHITMSVWVQDYLFKPLGGFRIRNPIHYSRIMIITMGLVGLWHGAQWTFVIWGILNGVSLFIYHLFSLHILRHRRRNCFFTSIPWLSLSWAVSMVIRILISILFFSPDLQHASLFFERLCLQPTFEGFNYNFVKIGFIVISGFWIFHMLHEQLEKKGGVLIFPPPIRGALYASLFFIILFGAVDKSTPFIYFQF